MQCLRFAKVAIKCQLSHINELKDPGLFHTTCLPDLVLVWDHYDIANQQGRVWFTYFEFGHMAVFSYDPALCCDMILARLIREPVSSVLSKQWRCGSQETRHSPSQKAAQSLNNATNLTAMQNCMCVNCIFGALRNATLKKQLACLLMKLLSMEKGPLTCFFHIVLLQFSTLGFSGVGGSLSPCLVFC